MKSVCPGAEFACEMQVKFDSNGGGHLETPESEIEAWVQSIKTFTGWTAQIIQHEIDH